MRRGWIVIEAAPMSSMVVIRCRRGGAYPFLGFGVEAITDTVDGLIERAAWHASRPNAGYDARADE